MSVRAGGWDRIRHLRSSHWHSRVIDCDLLPLSESKLVNSCDETSGENRISMQQENVPDVDR